MDIDPNSIEHLILEGAAEVAGMNLETGEMMYTFTPVLKEINPGLYDSLSDYIYGAILSVWTKGFVDLDAFDPDSLVKLTPKAFDIDAIKSELSDREQQVLKQLLIAFQENDQV
jgi:hypothetical protein